MRLLLQGDGLLKTESFEVGGPALSAGHGLCNKVYMSPDALE